MPTNIPWNGSSYPWPNDGEADWEAQVIGLLTAIATYAAIKPVAGGAAPTSGSSTLVGGTVTVPSTAVASTSRIFVMVTTEGGTPGRLRVSAKSPGVSFTITSSSATETSTVDWFVVNT